MTSFGFRRRLVRLLGGTLDEETDTDDLDQIVIQIPGGGIPPGLAALLARAEDGPPPGTTPNPEQMVLPASPTMRNGPTSPMWAMKVVDCNGQEDPATDAEVQVLLSSGWEPFSVCKFHTLTGAVGIRMYFKRLRPTVYIPTGNA